ncbi:MULTISPECIES: hypothetical protein [unclassified Streptomyces]|uniref:hypothetical protein n=1 Tax=unclassified Streptomyces TaxID=2593676 RepID=UPI000DABA9F8|nr:MULTISPECIES: hypothetical protein [unclassified Streptomyces]PZT77219.1 hypothetical protein DNK56_28840 [Streptomyces sp. AC1-42W]PZT78829.1 hypothetical protein DNK55_03840 [Streptomyces sp. AC1-42T]
MYRIDWRTAAGHAAMAKTYDADTVRQLVSNAITIEANPEIHNLRVRQLVACPIILDHIWADVTAEFV